jgi:hypothetical protein
MTYLPYIYQRSITAFSTLWESKVLLGLRKKASSAPCLALSACSRKPSLNLLTWECLKLFPLLGELDSATQRCTDTERRVAGWGEKYWVSLNSIANRLSRVLSKPWSPWQTLWVTASDIITCRGSQKVNAFILLDSHSLTLPFLQYCQTFSLDGLCPACCGIAHIVKLLLLPDLLFFM